MAYSDGLQLQMVLLVEMEPIVYLEEVDTSTATNLAAGTDYTVT